ncbi:hypothetical protein [Flavobacterium amniphilum]|nr:hypothetical protein [Flavobacterium amniphilum]
MVLLLEQIVNQYNSQPKKVISGIETLTAVNVRNSLFSAAAS